MVTAKKTAGRITAKKPAEVDTTPLTPEDLFALKQPTRVLYPIITDSLIADARAEASQALKKAEEALERAKITTRIISSASDDDPKALSVLAAAVKAVEEAEAEYEARKEEAKRVTLTFTLKALGRIPLMELYADHVPTPEQQEQFEEDCRKAGEPTDQKLDFNTDSFPPALLRRSCISPRLTEEQAEEMWKGDRFSQAELDGLFIAAVNVNKIVRS